MTSSTLSVFKVSPSIITIIKARDISYAHAIRNLLYDLYDPYTKMLPQLLQDPSFTWPKSSYEQYVQKMLKKKMGVH